MESFLPYKTVPTRHNLFVLKETLSGLGFVQHNLLPALNIFVLNSLVRLHLAMAELST